MRLRFTQLRKQFYSLLWAFKLVTFWRPVQRSYKCERHNKIKVSSLSTKLEIPRHVSVMCCVLLFQ